MSEPVATGHNDETHYRVEPTGTNAKGEPYSMDPVCIMIRSGSVALQDYLTPDAARALGRALIDTANAVEPEPQRCEHGRTADEPCGDCLADDGLDK